MQYKHSCVIDAQGFFRRFVLVALEEGEQGQKQEVIQYGSLEQGETLLDEKPPAIRIHAGASGFLNPRWNKTEWAEGAGREEAEAWEREHPAPSSVDFTPSSEERIGELEAQLTDAQLALAEMYETLLQAQTETKEGN